MGATLEKRVTAFGETKTVAEWEMDRRAAVYGELILRRIAEGMTPEQAVSTPTVAVERGPTKYMAWGERKTLRDWADDPRCATSYPNLRRRIEDGWAVAEALATPTKVQKLRTATAWGETKSLTAWAEDERAGASRDTIATRLDLGWTPEDAISTFGADPPLGLTAWGETKTVEAWSRDARCCVSAQTLAKRLRKGMAPEEAISRPAKDFTILLKAFGETKSLTEWALDARCAVAYVSLCERVRRGVAAEEAITTPPERPTREIEAWGEVKSLHAWSKDARAGVALTTIQSRLDKGWDAERAIGAPPEIVPTAITAWGETKGAAQWARDDRAAVGEGAILYRIEAGMTPEEAIATPGREVNRPVAAFGESKSAREWSEDARCRVSFAILTGRLGNGWEAESALTTPIQNSREAITAWGETKAAYAWSRDPRCVVSGHSLSRRIDEGWTPEEALSTPGMSFDKTPITAWGETKSAAEWERDPRATNRSFRTRMARGMSAEEAIGGKVKEANREGLTAFGEWRSFKGWEADPRCSVEASTIMKRVAKGMAPEEAITTPGRLAGHREEDALRLPGMPSHARPILAWGETKSQSAWERDARCPDSVTMHRIRERLDEGWTAEEAIGTPHESAEAQRVEAWGECRTLREWAQDDRAVVGPDLIRNRVKVGWSAERAITTPNDKARHEITAFGETKLATTWGRDERARASHSTILRRVEEGWEPEAAITTPAVVNRPKGVAAFGETKNLAAWGRDERAVVSEGCIANRIARGWTPEEAITTPGDNGPVTLTAFGETKISLDWAEDARCAVSRTVFLGRIRRGWAAERAMTETPRPAPVCGVTAFGETKSVPKWAQDPRCLVDEPCLRSRLTKGESPEAAMGRPSRLADVVAERRGQAVPEGMESLPVHAVFVTAFGETRSLSDWARDARCVVGKRAVMDRIRAGMTPEAALTTVPERGVALSLEAFGERKSGAEWGRDPRCAVSLSVLYNRLGAGMAVEAALTTPSPTLHSHGLHEAFGETRTLKAWSEDPRCTVTYSGLKSRVLDEGMAMEAALTAKIGVARRGRLALPEEAFGETKPLGEWLEDARCAVRRATVLGRLSKGWPLEKALAAPNGTIHNRVETGGLHEAFGETKTLARWVADARCVVGHDCLRGRIAGGMSVEAALTTPLAAPYRTAILEAFGERKTLREWAADPRCAVSYDNLLSRVSSQGVALEKAMSVPVGRMMNPRPRRPKPAPKPPKGLVTAFGETKPRRAWAADPRCAVTADRLAERIKEGMTPEAAITTPNRFAARLAAAAEEGVPEGYAGRRGTTRIVLAFGEAKSMNDWAKDERCRVSAGGLRHRLDTGMSPEEAMTAGSLRGVLKSMPKVYEAFGERKTLDAWMEDARGTVPRGNVLQRMRGGWSTEEALGTPTDGKPVKGPEGRLIEAFGERKNLNAWARDPRCPVEASTIGQRLKAGWSPQRAVETPALRMGDPRRRKTESTFGRELTAWGETKRMRAWAKDPRCVVSVAAVARRLSYGWTAERALGEPQHAECLVKSLRAA